MQKIDLHQDLISSFSRDLSLFQKKVEWKPVGNTNAGGLPNYKEADLQIVWAWVWPYQIISDPNNPQKRLVQFSNKKLISDWKQYELLRKENAIALILDGKELAETKYVDFQLNFVYHLKWMDGLAGVEDVKKLQNAWFRSMQLVWEFDNHLAHCHRSAEGGLTELGLDILQYMDQNKIIIDTANMNYPSMIETYQFTKKPIMNSHANVMGLYKHSRNVTDDFLDLINKSEWIIGLSLSSSFIRWDTVATIDDYIEQIKYVRARVWDSHIALGSGYHSVYFNQLVSGLENISDMTLLEERIVKEFGYKFAGMFFWENAYRFLVQTV